MKRRTTNSKNNNKGLDVCGVYKTPDGTQNFLKTGVKKNNGATEADGQELDHELLLAAGTSTRKMFIFLPTSPGEETLRGNKMCVWAQPAPVQEKKHSLFHKNPSVP